MSFARRMQSTATRLLSRFDERTGDDRLAILKQGERTFNPALGEYEIGPDTKCFLTGVQRTDLSAMVNGTTIQAGDKLITASVRILDEAGLAVDYVPQVNDKILMDGAQWSIVDTPHSDYTGKGIVIVYKMQVRK